MPVLETLTNSAMKDLRKKKIKAQKTISEFGLEVTYYNIFNKMNRRARKSPDRFMICLIKSSHDRMVIVTKAREMGYKVEMVPKKYPVFDPVLEREENWHAFKIDLQSVLL